MCAQHRSQHVCRSETDTDTPLAAMCAQHRGQHVCRSETDTDTPRCVPTSIAASMCAQRTCRRDRQDSLPAVQWRAHRDALLLRGRAPVTGEDEAQQREHDQPVEQLHRQCVNQSTTGSVSVWMGCPAPALTARSWRVGALPAPGCQRRLQVCGNSTGAALARRRRRVLRQALLGGAACFALNGSEEMKT